MNSSLHRLLLCTALASLGAACVEPATDKDGEPFTVRTPGKADGTGMVSPEEMARIETAFDQAVTSGQATIEKLEVEIAALEARHAEQKAKADALVQGISAREAELKQIYNNNLVLCLAFPNPATCVLANIFANDSTLQSYRSQLAAAQEEQRKINAEIEAYRAKRDDLRARIETTRMGKTNLLAMLRDDRAPSVPVPLADSPSTGKAFWRANTMTEIEAAIRKEINLLLELRDAAVELSLTLDESITTLSALEQSVTDLVVESRGQFMDLLKGYLSGDPAAAAQSWLDDVLARRTGEILSTLEFPFSEFARHLVTSDGASDIHDDEDEDDVLVSQILHHMLDGSGTPSALTFTAATPVELLDNTRAWSWINVAERREISLLEVYVDIEHTHIRDLIITLENGARKFMLSNHAGSWEGNLARTYVVPAAEGLALEGRWTLVVRDTVGGDTGTLKKWQLVAR